MNILNRYKECFLFLKSMKIHLAVVLILFIGTILLGYIAPVFFVEAIRELLKNLVDETEGMNFSQLFVFIFQNNLKTAFLGIILGIFLGVIPLFYAVTNGYILGFVASQAAEVFGPAILLRLLPHGIFELPALIISLALGLKLGTFFLTAKNKSQGILAYITAGMSTLIIFAVSLMLFGIAGSLLTLEADLEQLVANPFFLLMIVALFIVSFILGLSVGTTIISKKDKSLVKENLIKSFEAALALFLFVILPLLLVAGFIESALIIFFG